MKFTIKPSMKFTIKSLSKLAIPALAGLLLVNNAHAWEATTTHAGLTEQSAYASDLHRLLAKQFRQDKGSTLGSRFPALTHRNFLAFWPS
ncbi:MAG: hypothetical protein JKY56_08555 [Kofleriaceae bacterium]|nr:hypothetical protein [Kofleriaceae bacterium]